MRGFILSICVLFIGSSFGQTQKIKAYLDEKQFYAPGVGNYIEIQLQFVGYTFKYKPVEGGLQGEVVVRLDVKSADSIIAGDAFRLKTPIMKDSVIEDFYDLKRFSLKPGSYTLAIELQDINGVGEPVKATKPFIIEDLSNQCSVSDIQVSEIITKGDANSVFYKSGYKMIPNLSTFYPAEISKLPIYFEIYNSAMIGDSVFGLKQSIVDGLTGKEIESSVSYTRHKKSEVVPILRSVDISSVPTGKYSLDFLILSRDLKEITKKSYEFERSNTVEMNLASTIFLIDPAFQSSIIEDSVSFYLASLIPMSRPSEVKNILALLKTKKNENARKYIQEFWMITAPSNSYEGWLRYKSQVLMVEKLYKNNFQAGFETDRGRVYLQYGPPTTVLQKDVSSSEYPYEIWQFNKIEKFSNKRFIFYNPDLVNNAYRLLHSDMIGELKNSSWQLVLNKRNSLNGTSDDPNQNVQPTYGGNSNENFKY